MSQLLPTVCFISIVLPCMSSMCFLKNKLVVDAGCIVSTKLHWVLMLCWTMSMKHAACLLGVVCEFILCVCLK